MIGGGVIGGGAKNAAMASGAPQTDAIDGGGGGDATGGGATGGGATGGGSKAALAAATAAKAAKAASAMPIPAGRSGRAQVGGVASCASSSRLFASVSGVGVFSRSAATKSFACEGEPYRSKMWSKQRISACLSPEHDIERHLSVGTDRISSAELMSSSRLSSG